MTAREPGAAAAEPLLCEACEQPWRAGKPCPVCGAQTCSLCTWCDGCADRPTGRSVSGAAAEQPAPGEITRAAQAAFATYHYGAAGSPLIMPDSWDMQPAEVRADWLAAMQAGAEVLGALECTPLAAGDVADEVLDGILRDILESLCHRDGLSLESTAGPGPARNYELADRLGIGHVFGLKPAPGTRRLTRHADHDAAVVCRPAGNGLCETWAVTS